MHSGKANRLSSPSDSPSYPSRKCASDELVLRQRIEKRIISGFSREVSRSLKTRTEVPSSIPLEFPEGILPSSKCSEHSLTEVSATRSDADVRCLYKKFKELELEIQILNHKISYYFMGLQKRLRNARRKLKQVMRDAKTHGVYDEYNTNLKQNVDNSGDGAISRQPSVSFGPISTRRIPSRKELKQILNAKSRLSKSMEKSKSCLKDTKNSTCSAHHSRKRRREQTESEHSLSPHRKRRRKDSSDAGKAETETTNGSCFRKVLPPRTSVRQYRKRHRHGGHKY